MRIGGARPGRRDVAWVGVLVLLVVAVWCQAYGRTSLAAWRTPITYEGDALFLASYLKAASDGHVFPGASLAVPELNAPFEANWDDHPRTLRAVFLAGGIVARVVGLFPALNLLLLLAHVLAALSLYAVARYFGARCEWAFAGGVAFGLGHFLFWRSLAHLDLALCWHLPLCILVVTWALGRRGIPLRSRRFRFAVLVTVVTALHNPYFACLYAQFLLFAVAAQAARRSARASVLAPFALACILGAAFLLDNAGSLVHQWRDGPNPGASRPYGNLERYALKPLELLLPPPGYGLADWGRAARVYWDGRIYRGEGGSPYLGIVGAATLGVLFTLSLARLMRRPAKAPPPTALAIAWIVLFSMLGGMNQVLGILGFVWLRGTNRFSVWILALVLLFLVTRRFAAGRFAVATALLAAAVAVADQVPLRGGREALRPTQAAVERDGSFVAALEASLPRGAMIFMLPLIEFPEGRAVLGVGEYEHLRPYLHARQLHFSFGGDKGRPREAWQLEAAAQPLPRMVEELERCGFAGILVDRRAYPRDAAGLLADLAAAGRRVTLTGRAGDYAFVRLRPAEVPTLPGHTRVVGAAP